MILWSHPAPELTKFMEIVMRTRRMFFLEIGCNYFNMTILLMLLTAGDKQRRPHVIANDVKDLDPERKTLLFMVSGKAFSFVLGSSYDPKVVEKIKKTLGEDKLDILYIDGKHSTEAIELDTNNYAPLVDDEGYIIWHDALRGHGRAFQPWFLERFKENCPINTFFEGNSTLAYIQAKEWRKYEAVLKAQNT